MLKTAALIFLALSGSEFFADAFSASQMKSRRLGHPLSNSFFDHNGESPAEQQLQARTCVRNFLTQRAVQSFLFLLLNCRDPHTAKWLQVIICILLEIKN